MENNIPIIDPRNTLTNSNPEYGGFLLRETIESR